MEEIYLPERERTASGPSRCSNRSACHGESAAGTRAVLSQAICSRNTEGIAFAAAPGEEEEEEDGVVAARAASRWLDV